MKICPSCKAPNPPRLTQCYACGRVLEPPSAPSDVPTYPCVNCNQPIAFTVRECPVCGRSTTPPIGEMLRERPLVNTPPGWEVEHLPDGTVLLRRTLWGKLTTESLSPKYLFPLFLLPLLVQMPWRAFAVIAGLALVGILLYVILGREELRVGQNYLERCVGVGQFVKRRRITDGHLTYQYSTTAYRGNMYHHHRLYLRGIGGQLLLSSYSRSERRSLLTSPLGTNPTKSPYEITCLAEFLSTHTGWQFS
jgi:hypothetical protein